MQKDKKKSIFLIKLLQIPIMIQIVKGETQPINLPNSLESKDTLPWFSLAKMETQLCLLLAIKSHNN